ncbi:MAG TPA: chitobiase/beta-hexosaminidase C-terminal domain-containing protein [Bryobacteraceae bacterium]
MPFNSRTSFSNYFYSFFLLAALAGCLQAADVLTARNDNARTSANLAETTLTPQNVNVKTFGRLFSLPVDGYVYAQPLYKAQVNVPGQGVHNVLYVVTEHDSVYAFDANGNNPAQGYLWKVSFINPAQGITTVSAPADVGTYDIVPEIGITSTPVIDPGSSTIYVVAKTKETTGGVTKFVQRLHALDLGTGAEKMNGPVEIQATVPGSGSGNVGGNVNFDPRVENPRAALMLMNGVVYIAWAAHGDQGNYHGWVMGYRASNIQQQTGFLNDTPNGWGGGIWMSGGGISSDSSGNVYLVSGNGRGFSPDKGNYSESALRLSPKNGLSVSDYFTPNNQDQLDNSDADMGVSGALILPDQPGPYPHLLITADKNGLIYLINRDSMGGYNATANANVQTIFGGSSIHNSFAYFNNTLYVGTDGNNLQAFSISNGQISKLPSSKGPDIFGQNTANGSGSSPVISANGTSNGIVWALSNFTNGKGPAILYAYDASNLANKLYASNQAPNNRDTAGNAVKFTAPTVADGKVYVPGVNTVSVYGLFADSTTQPTANPTFGTPANTIFNVPTGITISDATPGAVIYYTTDGSVPTTSSAVYNGPIQITGPTTISAFAQAPGFTASQVVESFYTVQSADTPPIPTFSSGFTAKGLALNGTAALNGTRLRLTDTSTNFEAASAFYTTPVNVKQFSTEFQFQLTSAQADGFTFTIQGEGPNAIGSTGGGLGYGTDPSYHISFGERTIPQSVAIKFDLYDNGGEGTSSTGIYQNGVQPTTPAIDLLSKGIDLHNGDLYDAKLVYDGKILTLTLVDTAHPANVFTTQFTVDIPAAVGGSFAYVGFTAGTGGQMAVQEITQWTYSASSGPSSGGFSNANMTLNNGAALVNNRLRLTDGGLMEARSAYLSTPVNVQKFTSDFQFQLTSALADGFTFVIQNQGPHAVGSAGSGLAYGTDYYSSGGGIVKSVALKFDLFSNAGEGPSSTGLFISGMTPLVPAVDLRPYGIDLHSGDTFAAHVTYDGATLAITLTDLTHAASYTGSYTINIPAVIGSPQAYVGFTGGTGWQGAVQDILSFSFSSN